MGHLAKLFLMFAERPGRVPHPFLRLLVSIAVASIERRAASVPTPAADAGTINPPLAEEKSEKAAAEEKSGPLDDAGPRDQVKPLANKGSGEEDPSEPPRWTSFKIADADKVPDFPLRPHELCLANFTGTLERRTCCGRGSFTRMLKVCTPSRLNWASSVDHRAAAEGSSRRLAGF